MIPGATSATYTAVAADAGKRLAVRVIGTRAGHEPAIATSAQTAAVAKGTLVASKPRIKGTVKVGKTLTVRTGTWTTGTKLTFVWKADGKAVKGAKTVKLKLTRSMAGKRVTVTATGVRIGYTTRSLTSAKTEPGRKK